MHKDSRHFMDRDFLFRQDDFKGLVTFLLKGALNKQARDVLGRATAEYVRAHTRPLESDFSRDVDTAAIDALQADGYYIFPNVFSPEDLSAIGVHLADRDLAWHSDTARGLAKLDDVPNGAISATYDNQTVRGCPAFARCAQDPGLIRLMSTYLGAPATISSLTAWWSLPTAGTPPGHQQFHHDRGDFRSCNLFVYLTDVDASSGPHRYVPATHEFQFLIEWAQKRLLTKEEMLQFIRWLEKHRKPDAEVEKIFTPERILTFLGPAGTSFFEDTRGLHKGTQPRTTRRLVFEICYSVLPKYNETFEPLSRKDLGVSEEGLDDLTRYATRLMYA